MFYNAAHPDLIAPGYLTGDESVELVNLSPEGRVQFKLPGVGIRCAVTKYVADPGGNSQAGDAKPDLPKDDDDQPTEDALVEIPEVPTRSEPVKMNVDTLCIIPDEKKFYLVWRGRCQLHDLTGEEVAGIEVKTPTSERSAMT
jgi:hypothetical protein